MTTEQTCIDCGKVLPQGSEAAGDGVTLCKECRINRALDFFFTATPTAQAFTLRLNAVMDAARER